MKFRQRKALTAIAIASAFVAQPSVAATLALDLAGEGYYTYGNTNSYSLPILANQYDLAHGGGVGPGNPFYVASGPGQIKDMVVIYTGSDGAGVSTNVAGFEDAYGTPNGSSPTFSSTTGVNIVSPTTDAVAKGIKTIYDATWDASLAALKTYLNGGNPLFLFNNNDTNSDQNLAIWAKLWVTNPDGTVYNDRYLYLSNEAKTYGAGGTPLGDAHTYDPGNVQPQFYNTPVDGTDYVLSGGDVCVDKTSGAVDTGCGANTKTINHNLGANQAAYAADVPLLNEWLAKLASDPNLADYTLHLQLNLGCDPIKTGSCDNYKIDNGYEQLFLASSVIPTTVPEPETMALIGLGLLGAFASRRFQRK